MSKKRTMNELRQTKDSVYNHPDWKEQAIKQAATMCEWLTKGCDCSPTEAWKCHEENKEKIAQYQPMNYIGTPKQDKI